MAYTRFVRGAMLLLALSMWASGCNSAGPGGNTNTNDNTNDNGNQNDNSSELTLCSSPGGEDQDIDFSNFGLARVVLSTIGEGRHLVLAVNQTIVFEFDLPIPFCAVIPDNITLRDLTTGTDVPLADDQLVRENLMNDDSEIVASRIIIDVPDSLVAGNDYELTLDTSKLGLDGDFQQNAGTANASNGTLPSGDGNAGGDFVQLFRAIGAINFLTDTQNAGGLALDANDKLFIVAEQGLFGPFDAPKAVVEGDRLGQSLPNLANDLIAVDNDGNVLVKDSSTDGKTYRVDPTTGVATQIAVADVSSLPDGAVIAPAGYASVQRSAVEPGDLIISDTGSITVLDIRGGSGDKGGLNLVDRAGSITDTYVSLFVPPSGIDDVQVVYGAYKPEEDTGFEMHRILPDGTVDSSAFTNPSSLLGVEGTSAVKLDNIQGREEYLIIGDLDTQQLNTKQLLPDSFDGRCLMVYNETESRLQVLFPLAIDSFAFTFGPFSDTVLTSDRDTAYVSLPSSSSVTRFAGFANGNATAGSPSCDSSFDNGLTLASGSARVFRSTLGNGRHLLKGAPTVLRFDIDQIVPLCAVSSDNISLSEFDSGTQISLADQRIRRQLLGDGAGCRIVIDLPDTLSAGTLYELTLAGDAMGLDGDFQDGTGTTRKNGTLPSGDGTAGGDFVQVFQLLEGSWFLTETSGAVGIDLDGSGALYASTDEVIMGPFSAPATPTASDFIVLGDMQEISGTTDEIAGRPMVANDNGGAAATYASLRNSRLYDADPTTGIQEIFQTGLGSYEIDMVEAPSGFAGDYIVHNESRGVLFDVDAGSATTIFESSDQLVDFSSLYVTPDGRLLTTVTNSSTTSVNIFEVDPGGDITGLFPANLRGASASASAELADYLGAGEYLILGDWDTAIAQLATGQIEGTDSGTELILYNPTDNRVQVIGSFSFGADMVFTQDLDVVYTSNPTLRGVLSIEGLDAP